MATAEAALVNIIVTDPAVAALIGPRCYPDVLPQGVAYPAMRYARISTARAQFRTLDGKANYARPRFQLDFYALSKSQAIAGGEALYACLEGFNGYVPAANGSPTDYLRVDTISAEDQASDVEEGAGPGGQHLFRTRVDIFIMHPE